MTHLGALSKKTVLITGAAGSIGHKLRTHFAALGWELLLIDCQKKNEVLDRDVVVANPHFSQRDAVIDNFC